MVEVKKILDDILLQSFDIRPEVQWLQKQYLLFMEENGLRTKKDADTFLYEKMYAALPEHDSQITKVRFWRTGHHVPSDRKQLLMFGKALGLDQDGLKYLLQVYADRSDLVFDASSADSAQYRERCQIMDALIQEYLDKLHPLERWEYGIATENPLSSLRHIYFSQVRKYTCLSAESGSLPSSRIDSISYGSELLSNIRLCGEIPRKTMIRHILVMCIPFINERVVSIYLSAFGYCPLQAEHTLTGGERFDAMLLEILALYRDCCLHKSPEECRRWLLEAFRYADQYLCDRGQNRLRPFYFKALEREGG